MARVNTKNAFTAWVRGQSQRKCAAVWTTGGILYSYSTPIAKWSDADGDTAIVNLQKYSVTTSCQQSGLLSLLAMNGKRVVRCESEEDFKATER